TCYNAITDTNTRTKPDPPVPGAAGWTYTDPTFGSTILRVTDGNTRPGALDRSYHVQSNAHLASWNTTGTMFYVTSNDGTVVPFTFNPATMTAARIPGSGDGGLTLPFYTEAQFSLTNANLIYGGGGANSRTILTYDFSSSTTSTLVDLAAPRNASQVYLWDTTTDAITAITSAMLPGGHDASGYGVWVNQDCCTSTTWDAAQWQFRSLSAPQTTKDLINPVLTPQEI